jgi:hypothetical protein
MENMAETWRFRDDASCNDNNVENGVIKGELKIDEDEKGGFLKKQEASLFSIPGQLLLVSAVFFYGRHHGAQVLQFGILRNTTG